MGFHVYVCAAILTTFSKELQGMNEFQDIILYLQNMPTEQWGERQIELVLSQAWVYLNQYSQKGLVRQSSTTPAPVSGEKTTMMADAGPGRKSAQSQQLQP